MAKLWGFAGHSGSGKTTAINVLESVHGCCRVYLGEFVLEEVRKRGLPETRESERSVRKAVRQAEGVAAFVDRAADQIHALLAEGRVVLVDAVFTREEWDALQMIVGSEDLRLIFIECPVELRVARLGERSSRPFNSAELAARDHHEREELRFDTLRHIAHTIVRNTGTRMEFDACILEAYDSRR